MAVLRTGELVGRTQCENLAHERGLVPSTQLQVLEEAIGITQESFDTRMLVAVDPGHRPGQPLVGHVMAFGGFLRKCYVFDFSTEVDGGHTSPRCRPARRSPARRILGGLKLGALGVVPRQPAQTIIPPAVAGSGGAAGQPPP